MRYAPPHPGDWDVRVVAAVSQRLAGRRVVALAGAGCSTESGIPDYRGPVTGLTRRQPVQLGEFLRSDAVRRRYWARSSAGWPRMRDARPNAAHDVLARLEERGALAGLITQNVDGLHQAAGSRNVVELHGNLARVTCLGCGASSSREALQQRLLALNPGFSAASVSDAPDGDADLAAGAYDGFQVPACAACGGVLKPDVVFFGENVPRDRVDASFALLEASEVLLVVGSSLTVFSGFRFARRAHELSIPVIILNAGPTRADALASLRVEARLGDFLPALHDAMTAL